MNQASGSTPATAVFLVAVMCLAQVLGMLGVFAFPALLPHFIDLWGLTNSQAGWISGIYFAGYSIAVPVLTSLTDRMDSRKIYLASCFVSVVANMGFILDITGGRNSIVSWGLTFGAMGITAFLGVFLFFRTHNRDNP